MLDLPSELTINATAFKARCLGLMDDLTRGRLKNVFVTKHGKVVSVLTAADVATAKPAFVDDGKYPSYWGCMKGESGFPSDFDWDDFPGVDPPDVDAMSRNMDAQLGDNR